MNHKKMLLIFAGIAIGCISLGFLLDNDQPYDSIWQTVFEFCWLTALLFGLQAVLYFLGVCFYKLAVRFRA
ncbi:hypothetical protein G5B37_05685 [Rasiella rasia]|uniref:Uncharacterized protein n=1 Tax=Rasiella rasia TaxID=2744027 RepID=A0A6G6GKJ4_9FLAO|nr:hypothetical protein [Rasiella rasia]QIE59068.1 hypothetical protein G5B37_05685 [Rasiella rasia]